MFFVRHLKPFILEVVNKIGARMAFGYVPDFRNSKVKDLYFRVFGFPYAPRRNEARLVLKHLQPEIGEKVLDIGCGEGVWSNDLSARGYDVTGLDLSPRDIEKAKERAKKMGVNAKLVVGNAEKMPFKNESFDKIFSVCVFEHIKSDEKAFKECNRLLKKKGILVVSLAGDNFSSVVLEALKFPKKFKEVFFSKIVRNAKNEKEYVEIFNKKFNHYRLYGLKETIERVKKYGFEVEAVDFNGKFFGRFLTGLIHSLKVFEWQKTPEKPYSFKNQIVYAIAFPFFYPFFLLDDFIPRKKGLSIVLKMRKK